MRKKRILLLFIIGIIFLTSTYLYVQLSFKEVNISYTTSPQEALQEDVLIRNISSSPEIIELDDETILVIENAWLEKKYTRKNYGFWSSKKVNPDSYVVKIKYSLKSNKPKLTKKNPTDSNKTVVLEKTDGTVTSTNHWEDTISTVLEGNPHKSFWLNISNGVDQGGKVHFQ
ncbi:hypothetical protein [Phosphitispora sp. TUW77]|uniref:hypothetical protein n=1 Tax=Phosphitispora sp. TUW77 TaxID=3152361 RepID=UPI003AB229FF